MLSVSIRNRQNVADSPKAAGSPRSVATPRSLAATPRGISSPRFTEVGEIDTRAPFQSVKAAVSIFGGESPKAKPVVKKFKTAEERVLEKETQLQLALEELETFKQQLKSTETTKSQAQRELEKANRTLQELTCKLEAARKSKRAAIAAAEAAKIRAKQLKEEAAKTTKQCIESEKEQLKASVAELNSAKKELANIRQGFDTAMEIKLSAFQEEADAQHATEVNTEKLNELSKEIATMHQTLQKTMADKEARLQSHRTFMEEVQKKILSLKEEEESDPKLHGNFEEKLEETTEAIAVVQEQLKHVRKSDIQSLRTVNLELDGAKNALEEVLQKESLLRSAVDSLQLELDELKRDLSEKKEKEAQSETATKKLRIDDTCLTTIQQLTSETENARWEAEEMKKTTEELNQEAETARNEAKEAEEKLQVALKEAKEAKAAAKLAIDRVHSTPLCPYDAAHVTNSDSRPKIKLSAEDFETLSRKVEEFEELARMKVGAAVADVEASKASETELVKRLETSLKEREEIKAATEVALKRAEMAEAAKQAVKGKLQKWRQQEQKNEVSEAS